MNLRTTSFLNLFIIFGLMLTGFYLQFNDGLQPCPLCGLQRLAFMTLGILFLFLCVIVYNKILRKLTACFIFLVSTLGIITAGRQIWLQHFPSSTQDVCGASLMYLLKILPLSEAIKKIFIGTAECSENSWRFLYLTIAEWSLLWFIFFSIMGIYFFMTNKTRGQSKQTY